MRIVVAVDLGTSGHEWLMQRAARYAARLGGAVDVYYVHGPSASPAEIDGWRQRMVALLDPVPPSQRGAVRVEPGSPADSLVALTNDYELLVVGPREPGAIERMLSGPMAVRVLRRAHCPVLVPRGPPLADEPPGVLAGVDVHGDLASTVIALAGSWAERLGGKLDAVYATGSHLPPIKSRAVRERAEREWAAAREPDRKALEALLATIDASHRGDARIRPGEPEDALVSLSVDYDLVIVGNRERPGIAGWLLGTVANHVVRTSSCDVLTLPTADLDQKAQR